jgi:amidase
MMPEMLWQEIAAQKRDQRASRIPPEWRIPENLLPPAKAACVQDWPSTSGFFTDRELLISESTASEIVQKIAARQWSSYEVTKAVCKRAAVAQQLLNCITEIFFDEAIARARSLDAYLERNGHTVGPLHGLPIR